MRFEDVAKTDDVIIFGCGNIGKRIYAELSNNGYENLRFADSAADEQTDTLLPQKAVELFPRGKFIIGSYLFEQEQYQQLKRLGVDDSRIVIGYRVKSQEVLRPRSKLNTIDYHIVEHCNLKCASCLHFSNIAEEFYVDIAVFQRDMQKFHDLIGDNLDSIFILGGEPFLHPNIGKFIELARAIFSKATPIILTNGILLNKMPTKFWKVCAQNGATISISVYPIRIPIDDIRKKGDEYDVKIACSPRDSGQWHQYVLDLDGKQDAEDSFMRCPQANTCHQLKDGKLYPCSIVADIEHFNKRFDKRLLLTEDDYLDIFSADCAGDIYRFLAKPVSFCRFCKMKLLKFSKSWRRTKNAIEEYL